MKVLTPSGVPPRVKHRGKTYEFDCISGTGEPVYVRREGKDEETRLHVLLVRSTFESSRV